MQQPAPHTEAITRNLTEEQLERMLLELFILVLDEQKYQSYAATK